MDAKLFCCNIQPEDHSLQWRGSQLYRSFVRAPSGEKIAQFMSIRDAGDTIFVRCHGAVGVTHLMPF